MCLVFGGSHLQFQARRTTHHCVEAHDNRNILFVRPYVESAEQLMMMYGWNEDGAEQRHPIDASCMADDEPYIGLCI